MLSYCVYDKYLLFTQYCLFVIARMSDSDSEGFKQSPSETVTQPNKTSLNFNTSTQTIAPCFKHPLSIHYDQTQYTYPLNLHFTSQVLQKSAVYPEKNQDLLTIMKNQEPPQLLSEYFIRKFMCVYNRFRQNLAFKRDLTIIIRNVSRQVKSEQLTPFVQGAKHRGHSLSFSADFEGGNLHLVFKQRKSQIYYLLLQNDINTHGYNMWFYFSIRSLERKKECFVITNLSKQVCFQGEAAILTFSLQKNKYERTVGYRSFVSRFSRCDFQRNYWSIYFQYEFQADQQVYFSLTFPFSFTKMVEGLKSISKLMHNQINQTVQIIGKSEANNIIPVLRIARKIKPSKKIVVFTARQHPSETVSSFVCEQIIKLLSAQSAFTNRLLQKFSFYIIPMVNVDGVIHGNSRTNLLGYDLNRCWEKFQILNSCQCSQIWSYLQNILKRENSINWFFDLHGHSREVGFFAYFSERNERAQIMHHLLSNKSPLYQPKKCCFQVGHNKRQSIRGYLNQKMHVQNAITIETSLFGFRNKENTFFHFQEKHFEQIALNLLESLLQTESLMSNTASKLKIFQLLRNDQTNKQVQQNNDELDSDSNPEEDYLLVEQRTQQIVQRTYISKSNISTSNFYNTSTKLTNNNKSQIRQNNVFKRRAKTQSSDSKKKPIKLPIRLSEVYSNKHLKTDHYPAAIQSKHSCQEYKLNFFSKSKIIPKLHQSFENSHQNHFLVKQSSKNVNSRLDLEPSLKNSLNMRRKIRLAFQNRVKSERSQTSVGNFKSCQQVSEIKAIIYPTMSYKMNDGFGKMNSQLKSKKQTVRQLRNSEYGAIINRK